MVEGGKYSGEGRVIHNWSVDSNSIFRGTLLFSFPLLFFADKRKKEEIHQMNLRV